MRWARFADADGPSFGLVEDGVVIPVSGHPFGGWEKSGRRIPLAELRLLPPVMPTNFFCAGLNYRAHAERSAYSGHQVPERPEVGYRSNNALTGHLSPIVRPSDCAEALVAEGELVAVIGRTLRHVSPKEAQSGSVWLDGRERRVGPGLAALWLGTAETATFTPGQVVEITIDGVGTLTNPVYEEKLP